MEAPGSAREARPGPPRGGVLARGPPRKHVLRDIFLSQSLQRVQVVDEGREAGEGECRGRRRGAAQDVARLDGVLAVDALICCVVWLCRTCKPFICKPHNGSNGRTDVSPPGTAWLCSAWLITAETASTWRSNEAGQQGHHTRPSPGSLFDSTHASIHLSAKGVAEFGEPVPYRTCAAG